MRLTTALVIAALALGCNAPSVVGLRKDGSAGGAGNDDPGTGGSSGDNGGSGGGGGGGGGGMAAGGGACPDVGAKRDCSPETCKKGTQSCIKGMATVGGTWGPCENVTAIPGCPPKSSPDGGGTQCDCAKPTAACESYCSMRNPPDAPCDCSKPTQACEAYCNNRQPDGGTCGCPPNAKRYCHLPLTCNWGEQTCAGGAWGECKLIVTVPVPLSCSPQWAAIFDFCCCIEAGLCCQDDFDGAKKGGFNPESGGNCPVLTCGSSPGNTWPPKSTCPMKGDCVPGKSRWCPAGVMDITLANTKWGTQLCQSDGSWGDCTPAASPPTGASDCAAPIDQYSSEYHDGQNVGAINNYQLCCANAGLCCERVTYCSPNVNAVAHRYGGPYSFGKCDGISCK